MLPFYSLETVALRLGNASRSVEFIDLCVRETIDPIVASAQIASTPSGRPAHWFGKNRLMRTIKIVKCLLAEA